MSTYRKIVDAEKQVSVALPAAAANVNSASIDLGQSPGQIENVEVEIAVDANSILVATKDIDVILQDSADDSSFTAIAEFASPVLTVIGDTGNAETKLQVRLPRTVRRYVRMNVAVETGGGDVTAHEAHLRLLF